MCWVTDTNVGLSAQLPTRNGGGRERNYRSAGLSVEIHTIRSVYASPKQYAMAQDLFMHPQSCIIQELNEENNEPSTSGIEHIDVAPTATEASSPDNIQQISASESAASEPAVPVSSAVDGGEVNNQPEVERVEQPVDPQLQQLLDDCERLKQEGNAAYGRGEYDEALQLYWQVICMICNTAGASEAPFTVA